jgi:L-iditol 2-dehydrogenase
VPIDIAQLLEKEIDYIGVNRYANAFETALAWLADGGLTRIH